jgi:hypothetical protein
MEFKLNYSQTAMTLMIKKIRISTWHLDYYLNHKQDVYGDIIIYIYYLSNYRKMKVKVLIRKEII